jgi:hypothetical protein
MYHWNDQSGGGTSTYYVYDVITGDRTPLSGTFVGLGINNVVSDDGSTVLGAGFGASLPPLVHDVASGTFEELPGSPEGSSIPLGLSPDGRYAAIVTDATDLDPADTNEAPDTYRFDLSEGSVERVSTAFGTGAQLGFGATFCGKALGQVLTGGRVCFMGLDEVSASDTNGFLDAFLTPPR